MRTPFAIAVLAEVPAPEVEPTPVVPDAPVAPVDPSPRTPAAPEQPATVPGPAEPASPVAPRVPQIESPRDAAASPAGGALRFSELLESAIVPSRRPAARRPHRRMARAAAVRAPSNTR